MPHQKLTIEKMKNDENIGKASILNDGSEGEFTASQLPLIPIIGALVCVLLICILLVDLSCYKINKTGNYNNSYFLHTS